MAKRTDMISYCGMYCGTCPAYTQTLASAAKDLEKELRRSKCDKAAPGLARTPAFKAFEHYGEFRDLLAVMSKMVCKRPCRLGGGSPECRIRLCAKGAGLSGCWECEAYVTCPKLKELEEYGDVDRTYLKNIRKIRRQGPAAFAKDQRR